MTPAGRAMGAIVVLVSVGLYVAAFAALIRASTDAEWPTLLSGGVAALVAVLIVCVRSVRTSWYSRRRIYAFLCGLCVILCAITIWQAMAGGAPHNELNGELLAAGVFLGVAPLLIVVVGGLLIGGKRQSAGSDGSLTTGASLRGADGDGDKDALIDAWQSVRESQALPGMRLWWVDSVESVEPNGRRTRVLCSDPRHEVTQAVVVRGALVESHSWIVVDEAKGVIVETASNAARRAWVAHRLRA